VALAPLLVAVCRAQARVVGRARRDFALGLLSGVVYFAGTVYWTGGVMARYGGLSWPVAAAVAGLLVAYLSLFPALFALAVGRVRRDAGAAVAVAVVPFLWVASEYGRLGILDGFPWVLLGYSQVTVLPVAQVAAVTGVFGLSWILAAASAGVAWVAIGPSRTRWWPLAVIGVGLVVLAGWGAWRISSGRLIEAGRPLDIGVVQANVSQDDKWDPARSQAIYQRYLDLTRQVIDQGAALVLWPESATPFSFAQSAEGDQLRGLARASGTAVLLGSDLWERGTTVGVYNAAFLVDSRGLTAGIYRKVQLVPFGEYVPFQPLLFFATPLVQAVSDFKAGTEVNALPLEDGLISVAICYEVVYPALIREGVLNGSELLTTITNDAWFGRSSAASQHFAMASLRAIEQGRYLVRAANTGVSGVVDPYGRVLVQTELFVERTFVRNVRLLDELTPYARFGDLIVWLSLACSAVVLLARYRR
jgi:apolipoprotein N-acyltransferase